MHQKINNQHGNNTVPETSNINKQKQPNQTHQILTNKKGPTKMNHKLRKMETPYNQTTHNQTALKKHYHKNKR